MIFLVITISEDEKELICSIFKVNNKFFYYVANNILHNQYNSEDILQDAFVKISENIEKIKELDSSQQKAFCVVIVKNLSLNKLRDEKITLKSEDNGLSDKCYASLDEILIEKENLNKIKDLIDLLPKNEKKLLYLKWGMKMNYKQVANILNISEDSARKRGQRIIRKIKKRYEEENIK